MHTAMALVLISFIIANRHFPAHKRKLVPQEQYSDTELSSFMIHLAMDENRERAGDSTILIFTFSL